jgi:branched-chain amino acid aminotransferase
MSHAMQRGSLVFDITTFHATSRGTMLFRARDHVPRFVRSAELIGLALPFDASALERAAREAVRAAKIDAGLLRWSAFFPNMEADVVPRDPTASVAVAAYAPSDALPPGATPKPRPERWRVAIFDDARKAGPEVFPPEAKVAASYLGPMLARKRAMAAGADEVVLLDREGNIAEAPTANVFAVMNGVLVAPALGRILHGITRDSVLALARAEGIAVREEAVTRAAFEAADEAFLVSSSLAVGAIGSINGRALPDAAPVSARLRAGLAKIQAGEDARFAEWLTPVGVAD